MLPTCPSYTVCARSEWCKDGELMFLVQKYEELKETTDSQHQADKRAIILLIMDGFFQIEIGFSQFLQFFRSFSQFGVRFSQFFAVFTRPDTILTIFANFEKSRFSRF